MPATIVVVKTHGAAGYETESTDTVFGLKAVDDHVTAPEDAPVQIPDGVGTNYSYECWMRFKCTIAPSNKCNNFKVWSSGAAVGTDLVITVNTDAVAVYATPVVTISVAGTRADFASKGTGSKISVAGTLINNGDKTDFSVFQLGAQQNADPGDMPDQTSFYSYDES